MIEGFFHFCQLSLSHKKTKLKGGKEKEMYVVKVANRRYSI